MPGLILRQIYADVPGQGAVVWQMGSRASEAAHEVEQIFREILPDAYTRKLSQVIRKDAKEERREA